MMSNCSTKLSFSSLSGELIDMDPSAQIPQGPELIVKS